MDIVFEDIEARRNFINYSEKPYDRFKVSPIIATLIRFNALESNDYKNFVKDINVLEAPGDNKYIIATGVAYHPSDWCGPDEQCPDTLDSRYPNKKSILEHLSDNFLTDLQNKKAFLLLDQSHEGYQPEWLWSCFHNMCDQYKVSPSQLIYVTGNLNSETQYDEWANMHGIIDRVKIIAYPHFEMVIKETTDYPLWEGNSYAAFEDQIEFKEKNLNSIKLYNALQKRPRAHRIWLFFGLFKYNLLNSGINTMNSFDYVKSFYEQKCITQQEFNNFKHLLPMLPEENPKQSSLNDFASSDCGLYLTSINRDTSMKSWFSLVSEASFGDTENTCFLSEKTFKPIICSQPFIIYGNKGSLQHLRNMGYKTFSPFIDETYDTLDTWNRYDAILKEISRLNAMSTDERLEWFKSMRHILEHNFNMIFHNSSVAIPSAFIKLKQYTEEQNV